MWRFHGYEVIKLRKVEGRVGWVRQFRNIKKKVMDRLGKCFQLTTDNKSVCMDKDVLEVGPG